MPLLAAPPQVGQRIAFKVKPVQSDWLIAAVHGIIFSIAVWIWMDQNIRYPITV